MSIEQLQKKIGAKADGNFGPNTLRAAQKFYRLTATQAAHFFGQTAHETGNFRRFVENLNYSASGLLAVFKKYFNEAEAKSYERQPERIANRVYANRMGNGAESSGDGWKFRGRGALQLTGRSNYQQFSDYLKNPEIMKNPDLVASVFAFESAIFFFEKNNLWPMCATVDDDSILKVTRRVNGGTHGLDDRREKTKTYFSWLSITML